MAESAAGVLLAMFDLIEGIPSPPPTFYVDEHELELLRRFAHPATGVPFEVPSAYRGVPIVVDADKAAERRENWQRAMARTRDDRQVTPRPRKRRGGRRG